MIEKLCHELADIIGKTFLAKAAIDWYIQGIVIVAGLLGFVGLIVPHGARKLVGGEKKVLLPFCALGGAGFVTFCDVVARLLFAPHEVPVGILISVLGGPFFLLLLLKKKGGRIHD